MVDAELERDLELERRKVRELQETARERDKEYQKLKVRCFDLLQTIMFVLTFGRFSLTKSNGKPCLAPQMKTAMSFLRTNFSTKRVRMQSISVRTMLTLQQLLVVWKQMESG
jgi:hypothetical protein